MKRVVFAVVSGSMGALIGLLVALLSGRNAAIVICAVLGAAASLLVRPGPEPPAEASSAGSPKRFHKDARRTHPGS